MKKKVGSTLIKKQQQTFPQASPATIQAPGFSVPRWTNNVATGLGTKGRKKLIKMTKKKENPIYP